MQQFSSPTFICDMMSALNEHLYASLVALATTSGAYQGMKNLRALAFGIIGGGFDPSKRSLGPSCYQAEFHWRFLCCSVTHSRIIDRNFCPFGGTHSQGVGAIYISEICREVVTK